MSNDTYSILGCGWLGFPLAKYFIENDINIKGSTTSEEKTVLFEDENIIPYLININDTPIFKDFLNTDVLVIMITSKQFEAYKNLVCEIEKSTVKKVIFISSTSVYPRLNKEYREGDETVDSLLVNVENLFRNNTNFKTTIIRFAGLFGGKRLPGNWFKDKKIPQPYGFVNMIHRDDCIAIIAKIIEQDIFGETFNACANHHPTRKAFYSYAKKCLGKPTPVFDESQPLQFKKISPEKLMTKLNYTFLHGDLLKI